MCDQPFPFPLLIEKAYKTFVHKADVFWMFLTFIPKSNLKIGFKKSKECQIEDTLNTLFS